jgi:hypothetical protein
VVNRNIITAAVLAFLIGAASVLLVVIALLPVSVQISNVAAIKTVGVAVYWDPAFTVRLTNISWGILEPGETKNVSCYIANKSNVPVILTLTTSNWAPTNASNFITLTWNYDGQPIPVGVATPITFSLHVDAATTGITAFSFDITITGSG